MSVLQHSEQFWTFHQRVGAGVFAVPRSTASWLGISQQDEADAITYQLRVPGYRRRDLEIEIRQRVVTVRGSRTNGWFQPRSRKSFIHSFELPDALDEGAVRANLARGILHLTIGKKPHARRRRIPVRVRDGAARPAHDQTTQGAPWIRLLEWLRSWGRVFAGKPNGPSHA